MKAKCKKCGVVFEYAWHPTLVHIGSKKLLKCPACGKSSIMETNLDETVTWPTSGAQK
jgi:transcription elongation factor Elf1